MTMQIKEIVLYNASGDVRRLQLRPGAVNIISGSSKTGKSALIDIVEYCLGREECGVPVGVIRDTVSWYGLLLHFRDIECFIARRDPGPRRSSSDMFLEFGRNLAPPGLDQLVPNTNPDAVVEMLSERIGIAPNQHEPPDGTSRPSLEASLKHTLFLVFQRQDEIAKRGILFHRQDEEFIPQAIKDTLPYFLGAVGDDRLALRQALRRERVSLRSLERQYRETLALRGGGLPRAAALVAEAENAGLIAGRERPRTAEESMGVLRSVNARSDDAAAAERRSVGEGLSRLRAERDDLSDRFRRVRQQLDDVRSLRHDQQSFAAEANAQRARLQTVELFEEPYADVTRCPVCESSLETVTPGAAALREALSHLDGQLARAEETRPRLDAYVDGLEREAASLQEALRDNQRAVRALVAQDRAHAERRDLEERQSYVLGRISVYLESLPADGDDDAELRSAIAAARSRVEALERELRDESVQEMVDSIMNLVGRQMSRWAERLELEHGKFPLRIDMSQLTVVADTDGGPVPMNRMGSGENWVGYHLIAHLALHRHFVQKGRPVPRFLFLDQPTQVYYPPERDQEGRLDVLDDEDRTAVRRMFALIGDVVEELAPGLQVIITDHADLDDQKFQAALVERWRRGNKLVPQDWTEQQRKVREGTSRAK
jgi:hypothetical protein